MNVESWAKEVRRLVCALGTPGPYEVGVVTLMQRYHGPVTPSKGKPADAGDLRWRAQCQLATADGATAEEAGAALLALLGKKLDDLIAERRAELARLEGHQAPGLRVVAPGEKPS